MSAQVAMFAVKTAKFSTFHPLPIAPSSATKRTTTHAKCLRSKPASYPARFPVQHVDWQTEEPSYNPPEFTHASVLANDREKVKGGWADPENWTPQLAEEVASRTSYALGKDDGKTNMVNGRPRNPVGRTGLKGRGLLGKYGANHAADPLVTRFHPETRTLQMVAIERADSQEWAIPGGMVDAGEQVSLTMKREFIEEARNLPTQAEGDLVTQKLDDLFAHGGHVVYRGYVDDPRNTDEAWMETTCSHFHIEDEYLSQHLKLEGGDDATKAKWLDISDDAVEFKNLYASHRDMVIDALLQNPVKFASAIAKTALL